MGNNMVCVVVGMVDIVLRTNSGVEFIFKKVKHVREIKRNLISIGSLDQEGYSIKAKKRCLKVIIGLMVILKGELNNVLYILRTPMHSLNITQNSVKSGLNELMLWHYRLVHVSCKGLKVIRKKGLLGNMNVKDLHFCEECIKGKASRLNFASNTYRASNVLDYAHANLWGPAKAQSLTGARYHFDGTARQFFEGWYFKVSIPEKKQNFCFMYTVENPAFLKKLTPIEEAKYGRRFTGVGAQILGADDKYICQYTEENQNFWGSRHKLRLGSTFIAGPNWQPPKGELPPKEFDRRVLEGFQVSPLWSQGCIQDDGRSDYVETVKTARWQYSTQPVYGWGNVGSKQKSTAGWLAVFPVFEPHWQICMSAGLSTGWIEWDGERFEFENAPSYSEKNWGGAFPSKWFWVQCNVFEGANKEVALTAAGGLRQLAGGMVEDAALVGVHYNGIFYEFVPWNGTIEWEIAPWGFWKISADNGKYKVELEAITEHQGTTLRAPTLEAGLAPACKDSCYGNLKLQIWERRSDGARGKIILDVTSDMAAVEIGGGPWLETWKGTTTTPELVKHALSVPIDMESIFDVIPFFKPPGL